VRQVLGEKAAPLTRLVELPGRGVTRVWECAGPPGARTLMLIYGVACTAELNWGKVFAPLAAHFRVIAADLRVEQYLGGVRGAGDERAPSSGA
jgi:3-oxoadipate enol-lactonase